MRQAVPSALAKTSGRPSGGQLSAECTFSELSSATCIAPSLAAPVADSRLMQDGTLRRIHRLSACPAFEGGGVGGLRREYFQQEEGVRAGRRGGGRDGGCVRRAGVATLAARGGDDGRFRARGAA